jgi:hypothetical protein
MDLVQTVVDPTVSFAKESLRFLNKCTKPDAKGNEPNIVIYYYCSFIL